MAPPLPEPRRAPFAFAVFLGAFLLFEVQFILAKRLLPWFGGAPAVWTTCMLFFQTALLAGYAYAYALARAAPRRQRDVHLALVAFVLVLLALRIGRWPSPLTPGGEWKPDPAASPVALILELLAVSAFLPYLALAATGPLVQSWWARLWPEESPYRLFALSNLGSLLGLLSYPFAMEPLLSVVSQGWLWAGGFALWAPAIGACAMAVGRADAKSGRHPAEAGPRPPTIRYGLWFGLSAVASTLLLAVTNQLCLDVAVIPFLWVLPLALYLLSFVLSFEYERFSGRAFWVPAMALSAAGAVYALGRGTDLGIVQQVAVFAAVLFSYCMVCHGELARTRPAATHLTSFYLTVAAGGAGGGLFSALFAPLVFPTYWELHLALLAGPLLLVVALLLEADSPLHDPNARRAWLRRALAYALLGALAWALAAQGRDYLQGAGQMHRGFFGVLAVGLENGGQPDEWRRLRHGRISHGLQFTAAARSRETSTYYGPDSGAGLVLRRHPRRLRGERLRIGLVGLGVGTLVAYAQRGDVVRVYEINPEVLRLSTGPAPAFTFLRDSEADVRTVLGDARLSLEREPPQDFDVLALDAFSGDAIPVHLLTREAFALYLRHLRAGGVLAVHVSNKYLDLKPAVRGLAGAFGLRAVLVDAPAGKGAIWSSDWVLAARDDGPFSDPEIDARDLPLAVNEPGLPLWTDSYSNLLAAVRR